jgi:sulfotransferase
MQNGMFFISGLPRSGSTLLSGLLTQNPAIHANISSPVAPMVLAMLREMSAANEGEVFIDDERRRDVLTAVFEAYYRRQSPEKAIFDTNRLWNSKLPLLTELFPETKVICCVRHMPWIYDSFEKLIRKNKFQPSRMFDFNPGGTVYSRFNQLNASDGVIGFAWLCLREAFYGEHADRLLLVDYETLTKTPYKALDAIYEFTGLEPAKHDINNVSLDTGDFDGRLGTPGLHTLRGAVRYEERPPVLPPDLFNRVEVDSFWRNPAENVKGVRII